jgi:putative membrane protein
MRRPLIAAALVTFPVALALAAVASDQSPDTALIRTAIASEAPAAALDDPTIVAIFDAANTADIETGTLAMERGHSKEVRDFGAMLARDHKAVRQQGRDLAKKLGVTPTPPADDAGAKAHTAAMRSLRALHGAAFDHAFLQHEVAFHKSVIDAVTTTLLPAIKNAEVKDLVVKVAPAFQAHMLAAANLDDRLTSKKK